MREISFHGLVDFLLFRLSKQGTWQRGCNFYICLFHQQNQRMLFFKMKTNVISQLINVFFSPCLLAC